MAHKTLIGGTAYEISGGKTLIDGTGYSIDNGKALADGTAYEVGFGVAYEVLLDLGTITTTPFLEMNNAINIPVVIDFDPYKINACTINGVLYYGLEAVGTPYATNSIDICQQGITDVMPKPTDELPVYLRLNVATSAVNIYTSSAGTFELTFGKI